MNQKRLITLLLLTSLIILGVVPLAPIASSTSCSYTIVFDTFSYLLTVTPVFGSCPVPYSSSPILHLLLSTNAGQNPYTVRVNPMCPTPNCTPKNIVILGWGNVALCGTSQSLSGTPCSTNGPWSNSLDATVQTGKACDTAPLKINGNSGQPEVIFEAGVVGDCLGPTSVPEFPVSSVLLVSAILPVLLVLRKLRPLNAQA